MSVLCGLVGLPNVGKSTSLNALTGVSMAVVANYPFSTLGSHQARVPVPDARLEQLSALIQPKHRIPAVIHVVDIPGLVAGAAKGEGLGNQFLSDIREVDALIHVVRCFEDADITHVAGRVNPVADLEIINAELIFADLNTVEKAIQRQQRQTKSGDKAAISFISVLEQAKQHLEQLLPLRQLDWEEEALAQLDTLHVLTIKPMLYLANVDEQGFIDNPHLEALKQYAALEGTQVIPACVKLEAALVETSLAEKKDLLNLLGCQDTSLSQLIQACYQMLGLDTFFTAGVQEVRAWTIRKGATAYEAAGCIHSDFQKGFIRAEVVAYEDFIQYQGEQGAKAAGKWRSEGKTYIVQSGDILHFRFNV